MTVAAPNPVNSYCSQIGLILGSFPLHIRARRVESGLYVCGQALYYKKFLADEAAALAALTVVVDK